MIISDILKNTEYSILQSAGSLDQDISDIVYDSRKAGPCTVFVCLKGAGSDGHLYAHDAYEKGCRIFLAEHDPGIKEKDAAIIICGNTRKALAEISDLFFGSPSSRMHLIGITGTKGKTTTALLIQHILNDNGIKCAYIGSNGFILDGVTRPTPNTTPESYLMNSYLSQALSTGTEYAAIEVSSQALDHYRVHGINFETCIYTNLSADHIGPGEHASFEEYKCAKRKLFTDHGCRNIVFNADDPYYSFMTEGTGCRMISCSMKDTAADFYASDPEYYRDDSTLGMSFTLHTRGESIKAVCSMTGIYSVNNCLAACAAASVYGISANSSAASIRTAVASGRCEVISSDIGATFVIDYAHNAVSLESILTSLRKYDPSRLICLFGSVGGRTQLRRKELAQISGKYADLSIITSDNPDFEPPEQITSEIAGHMPEGSDYVVIDDRTEAVRYAVSIAQRGDIILLAGKGHETYQLIRGEKVPFSERKIIESLTGR